MGHPSLPRDRGPAKGCVCISNLFTDLRCLVLGFLLWWRQRTSRLKWYCELTERLIILLEASESRVTKSFMDLQAVGNLTLIVDGESISIYLFRE